MSAPRQVLPGKTYHTTRRCSERRFFLNPSPVAIEIFLYCLAVASTRYRISIHAFCVMSNHVHLILTDPDARLPEFMQCLHATIARAMNTLLGRRGSFWEPDSYAAQVLVERVDVLDKSAYVLANPAAAGLVEHAREWPGAWSSPELLRKGGVDIRRPSVFFDSDGSLPECARLELTCPPGFEAQAYMDELIASVAAREHAAAVALAEAGRSFLGVEKLSQVDAAASPATCPGRRGIRPRIACKDVAMRLAVLAQLAAFAAAYRKAWIAFRDGARDVVFPPGTYWMRVFLRVRCAAPA